MITAMHRTVLGVAGLAILLSLPPATALAQYTAIPDSYFEQFLIDQGIDSEGTLDGQVLTADVAVVTSLSFPSYYSVSNLTGIQAFTALQNLHVSESPLAATPDLSQNTALTLLTLQGTELYGSLDLSANVNLQALYLRRNPNLSTLILGPKPNMTSLSVTDDGMTTLDLSQVPDLTTMYADHGNWTDLDFSANPKLQTLYMTNCPNLASLDLANGANNVLTYVTLTTCPSLFCAHADDPAAANDGQGAYGSWLKDAQIRFRTSCDVTAIPDSYFEQFLIDQGIDWDLTLNGQVYTEDVAGVTSLSFPSYYSVSNLTGIQAFTALQNLRVSESPLAATPDLSQNTALTVLTLQGTDLYSPLDLSANVNLQALYLRRNSNLSTLILGSKPNMISLGVTEDGMATLDLSQVPNLTTMNADYGNWTDLDVSANPKLQTLSTTHCPNLATLNLNNCKNGTLTYVDLSNCPTLSSAAVDDADAANAGQGVYGSWIYDGSLTFVPGADNCSTTTGVSDVRAPLVPMLQASPNPLATRTTLTFVLDRPGATELAVYDARGALVRRLVQETLPAGRYERTWDGEDDGGRRVARGIYFTRLVFGEHRLVTKLAVVR